MEEALRNEISSKITLDIVNDFFVPIIPPTEGRHMNYLSKIIDSNQALQIISYFPEGKRNFKVQNIYKASRDGWEIQKYI